MTLSDLADKVESPPWRPIVGKAMSREKAEELVGDLIEAYHDYEMKPRKSTMETAQRLKELVISHLIAKDSPHGR